MEKQHKKMLKRKANLDLNIVKKSWKDIFKAAEEK